MSSYNFPDNLGVILSYADSTDLVDRLLAGVFLKEKEEVGRLYQFLELFFIPAINFNNKSMLQKFFIDKNSGAAALELYAKGLSIAFGNDQNFWIWASAGDTRYEIYN